MKITSAARAMPTLRSMLWPSQVTDTRPGRSASQTAIATTTAILMKNQSARQKVMASLRRAVCGRRHQFGRDRVERCARLIVGEPRLGLGEPTGGGLRGTTVHAL